MKKLLTSLMAVMMLASTPAFAAKPILQKLDDSFQLTVNSPAVEKQEHRSKDFKKAAQPARAFNNVQNNASSEVITRITSMRKAQAPATEGASSLEGDWIFTLGNYYLTDYGEPSVSYEAQYNAQVYDDNIVVFNVPEPTRYEMPLIAVFDEANNNLVFQTRIIGQMIYIIYPVYITQEFFIADEDGYVQYVDTIVAHYDVEQGLIEFNPDNGVEWGIYGDTDLEEYIGPMFIVDIEGASKGNMLDGDEANWEDAGTALFVDGWILPSLGFAQDDVNNRYEVPLQQNIANANMYRLVDPYKVGPAAAFNQSKSKGYIEFDVTDPDHVIVNPRMLQAGFANDEMGITTFYCYNWLQYLVNATSSSAQTIVGALGNTIPYTTFKDNVVVLSKYGEGADMIYDANFGFQDDREGGYGWTDVQTNEYLYSMYTVIYLPGSDPNGINSVISDQNASKVYYDINGVRVDNPTSGLYIVKEGANVSKVLIK